MRLATLITGWYWVFSGIVGAIIYGSIINPQLRFLVVLFFGFSFLIALLFSLGDTLTGRIFDSENLENGALASDWFAIGLMVAWLFSSLLYSWIYQLWIQFWITIGITVFLIIVAATITSIAAEKRRKQELWEAYQNQQQLGWMTDSEDGSSSLQDWLS